MAESRIAGFLAVCVFLNGCLTLPDTSLFHSEEGKYLALPAGSATENQAQVLADQYGAMVKSQQTRDSIFSRQDYRREIAADIEAMMASEKFWVIVVTPANRDFISGIFGKIPAPSEVPSATAEGAPGLPGGTGAVPARGSMPWAGGRAKRGPLTAFRAPAMAGDTDAVPARGSMPWAGGRAKRGPLTVQVYGESTPELEKEMARLGLEKSVNRRPGDDK